MSRLYVRLICLTLVACLIAFQSVVTSSVVICAEASPVFQRRQPNKGAGQGSKTAHQPAVTQQSPRSVIVDNHQPLVDEKIMLDSSVRHHLSFINADSLSEFVVDDIEAEIAILRKTTPNFDKVCTALEGSDVDSEDALLRCLKRIYFPNHPIYTGRSGTRPNGASLRIEGDGYEPVVEEGVPKKLDAADTTLSALDESMLMDTDGWLPTQISNGSIYLCRMPRAGDTELVEGPDGGVEPKKKAVGGKRKRTVEELEAIRKARQEKEDKEGEDGSGDDKADSDLIADFEEEDDEENLKSYDQLKPGQRLPKALRDILNRRMRNQCMSKGTGWWTYEACWEQHVRQYHSENGKATTSHYLGQGPRKKVTFGTKPEDLYYNVHSVRGPYISATFKNGSKCDVTGEPRIAEIRLFCDEEPIKTAADVGLPEQVGVTINLVDTRIEISEPETCTYLVWMGSPKACLKQIKKQQGPIFGVRCRNVDDL